MRTRPLLVLLAALLALPAPAVAASPTGMDVVIEIVGDAAPAGPSGFPGVQPAEHDPGERYAWRLDLAEPYTTIEIRARDAFDVERPRQAVPTLAIDPADPTCAAKPGACQYPLFYPFPNERVWEVDGPARVFHVSGEADDFVLRLGVPGPVKATLALSRDVEPPSFTLGDVENLTHGAFYQETRTDELALADLQVRKQGAGEWIRNPTTEYHVLQRFPVQGLDADTAYEARVVFSDWAQNEAESGTYVVRTLPEPVRPKPVVTPVDPAPNATLALGDAVVIRATVASPESPVGADGVRVFFDKREVTSGIRFDGETVTFAPGALENGRHSVSVEAVNAAGGKSYAQWAFFVGRAESDGPAPLALAALAAAAALLLAPRRR